MAYKYKIDVVQALYDRGFTSYKIKQNNLLSQGTLKKLKDGGNVTLATLDAVCCMLKLDIGDIIEIKPSDADKIKYY